MGTLTGLQIAGLVCVGLILLTAFNAVIFNWSKIKAKLFGDGTTGGDPISAFKLLVKTTEDKVLCSLPCRQASVTVLMPMARQIDALPNEAVKAELHAALRKLGTELIDPTPAA